MSISSSKAGSSPSEGTCFRMSRIRRIASLPHSELNDPLHQKAKLIPLRTIPCSVLRTNALQPTPADDGFTAILHTVNEECMSRTFDKLASHIKQE